ncbi:EthD family reductase [Crenobacter cavernae]|uniref:EthD family reductase n=1 Tax=Crenobacter cavernae TaxID=2290923 RepID=A0ABY0FI56_9NEIS|nr:EthD family reductase [Crenobacter cavernae]RXZ44798.1 EthD family reductase [Crenobacter cavernae]
MIKVSVFYPNQADKKFDLDYYLGQHMPMVEARFGEACREASVEVGILGVAPGTTPAFIVTCHLTFDSVDAFQTAFAPHVAEIMGDIPNYTDIEPVIQIGEVRRGPLLQGRGRDGDATHLARP